jgi:hypothetical protein
MLKQRILVSAYQLAIAFKHSRWLNQLIQIYYIVKSSKCDKIKKVVSEQTAFFIDQSLILFLRK